MIYDYNGNAISVASDLFINVKDYGAKGNGVTDDASDIQYAIDKLKASGGIIYFPHGTYLIKSSLYFYSNQTLLFESGAVLLQGASINNLLRTFCDSSITGYNGVHDSMVYGATFDGGTYTTNNTLVATVHSKNLVFENCTFRNAYGQWHNLEINSSCNVKVINCNHEGTRKTSTSAELVQIDVANSSGQYPWDNINADGTACKYIEILGCFFHDSDYAPAIGNHNGTPSYISIHDNVFDNLVGTDGAIKISASNVDIYNNVFNSCTTGVGSSGSSFYIRGNRFVNATTAISGTSSVAHANMINGTYTA